MRHDGGSPEGWRSASAGRRPEGWGGSGKPVSVSCWPSKASRQRRRLRVVCAARMPGGHGESPPGSADKVPERGLPHSGPTEDRRDFGLVDRPGERPELASTRRRTGDGPDLGSGDRLSQGKKLASSGGATGGRWSFGSVARSARGRSLLRPTAQRGIVGGSRPSQSFGEGRRLASNRRERPDFGPAGAMNEACFDRKPAEGEGVSAPTRFANGTADLVPTSRRRSDPLRR